MKMYSESGKTTNKNNDYTCILKSIEKVKNSYWKGRSIQQCCALKPNKEKLATESPCWTDKGTLLISVFVFIIV